VRLAALQRLPDVARLLWLCVGRATVNPAQSSDCAAIDALVAVAVHGDAVSDSA
jgi:hypothetical protein